MVDLHPAAEPRHTKSKEIIGKIICCSSDSLGSTSERHGPVSVRRWHGEGKQARSHQQRYLVTIGFSGPPGQIPSAQNVPCKGLMVTDIGLAWKGMAANTFDAGGNTLRQ